MASGVFTNAQDRQNYLLENPKHHRILNRWEIENYLFDKEVLRKYCELNKGYTFNEEKYNQNINDIENDDVKSDTNLIKSICGITFNIKADQFKLNLSKIITSDMHIYKELEECIFK